MRIKRSWVKKFLTCSTSRVNRTSWYHCIRRQNIIPLKNINTTRGPLILLLPMSKPIWRIKLAKWVARRYACLWSKKKILNLKNSKDIGFRRRVSKYQPSITTKAPPKHVSPKIFLSLDITIYKTNTKTVISANISTKKKEGLRVNISIWIHCHWITKRIISIKQTSKISWRWEVILTKLRRETETE